MKKKNVGSAFDSIPGEEGMSDEVSATAIKRVVSRQGRGHHAAKKAHQGQVARRMHASRAALDRLLGPDNDAVTLITLTEGCRRW